MFRVKIWRDLIISTSCGTKLWGFCGYFSTFPSDPGFVIFMLIITSNSHLFFLQYRYAGALIWGNDIFSIWPFSSFGRFDAAEIIPWTRRTGIGIVIIHAEKDNIVSLKIN